MNDTDAEIYVTHNEEKSDQSIELAYDFSK